MIKVSIIMPVYNAQAVLKQTLDSLLVQTLKDIEIICVNDGSSDNTNLILEEYANKNEKITVFNQQNMGAGAARNRGFKEAVGEYIAFLDCDDIYEPNMLEKMYRKAVARNLDVVVCRSDKFVNDLSKTIKCPWTIREKLLPPSETFAAKDIEQDFFMAFVWWPWDKLYRRDFIKPLGINYQKLRTTNDLFFVVCTMLKANRISWIDEILVHHRIGGKKSLSVTREKSWSNFHDALLAVKEFMIANDIYDRFGNDYINYCAHFSLWNLETIWGPSFCHLYNALKGSWFKEFGLADMPVSCFYNKADYYMVQDIINHNLSSNDVIVSRKLYQVLRKIKLYYVGYGLKGTLSKIVEKLLEYF